MKLTNEQVAERFVRGLPATGSNLISRTCTIPRIREEGITGIELVSYRTLVAVIVEGRLYMDTSVYSPTTAEHMRKVRRAWNTDNLGSPERRDAVYEVPFPHEGGSRRNVDYYLHKAGHTLTEVVMPRRHMATRVALWGAYLRCMEYADLIATLPCYGSPVTPEFMAEKYDPVNRAREGLNPVGLGEFDNDMLLRVKAITALEGE